MERAANAHATHVLVLVGLARLLNVERVVEYGCGELTADWMRGVYGLA